MSIIRLLKVADFLTIGNFCSGVLSIFFSAKGSFGIGSLLLLFAVVFDMLDGKVASLLHQKNPLGKQLDSLADVVSFGVAPAVLYFALSPKKVFVVIVLLFFAVCGMLRLARYNISRQKGFEGVPITVNGLVFPALYLLYLLLPVSLYLWPIIFVVMGFLMVSSVKIRRLF